MQPVVARWECEPQHSQIFWSGLLCKRLIILTVSNQYFKKILLVLLGEASVQVLCSFLIWVVCLSGVELCEFFIYFGDQTLVWGIIGKYVFPYCWFSFHFNAVFLAMQKLFILMRSHLFTLSFMSLALGDISVKICCMKYLRFSCLCCSLWCLWCWNLYLSLLFTLSLFLCML